MSTVAALFHRERTGEGQFLEGALLKTALTMMNSQFMADHADKLAKSIEPLAEEGLEPLINEGFTRVLIREPGFQAPNGRPELLDALDR